MKKLIKIYLMAALIMALSSCSSRPSSCPRIIHISDEQCIIYVIDSCEYVKLSGMTGISHKGNCKFCEERRRRDKNNINN